MPYFLCLIQALSSDLIHLECSRWSQFENIDHFHTAGQLCVNGQGTEICSFPCTKSFRKAGNKYVQQLLRKSLEACFLGQQFLTLLLAFTEELELVNIIKKLCIRTNTNTHYYPDNHESVTVLLFL